MVILRAKHGAQLKITFIGWNKGRWKFCARAAGTFRRSDGEDIPTFQSSTFIPSKMSTQECGTASHDLRHVDSPSKSDVGPATSYRASESKLTAGSNVKSRPVGDAGSIQLGLHFCAANCNVNPGGESETGPAHCHFHDSSVARIAREDIGHRECITVHGTGKRHSESAIPGTPMILHGTQDSGINDCEHGSRLGLKRS